MREHEPGLQEDAKNLSVVSGSAVVAALITMVSPSDAPVISPSPVQAVMPGIPRTPSAVEIGGHQIRSSPSSSSSSSSDWGSGSASLISSTVSTSTVFFRSLKSVRLTLAHFSVAFG